MRDLQAENQTDLDTLVAKASGTRRHPKALNLAPWRVSEPASRDDQRDPWESLMRGHIEAMAPRVLHGFDPDQDMVVIALPDETRDPALTIRPWKDETGIGVEIWLDKTLVAHIVGLGDLREDQVGIIGC